LARVLLVPWFRTAAAVFRGADEVVACSQGYLRWALRLSGREPSQNERVFHLGYSAVDKCGLPMNSPQLEALKGQLAGKIVFTYIGSFGYAYDLSLVCKVAKRISELSANNVHFVLAGGGQRFDELASLVRSMDNVTLTGWLNAPEMSALLEMSDVGLVPRCGTLNNVPNKPFEYMAAGLPILSSLEGEMIDIISRNEIGCSYASGDSEALLDHILRLAADPTLRKMQGQNSRQLFLREFDASVVYEKYSRFVESVAQMNADCETRL
jgi:glycosyltransferase involved in cell wall biosynthesis